MVKKKADLWLTKDALMQVEMWARDGLTDEQISKNMEVRRETLYSWRRTYPEFDHALKRGKRPIDFEVENALLKSALGFQYEETKVYQVKRPDGSTENRVEKTTRFNPPNVTAQIFWLKNRKPEKWSDRKDVYHAGEVSVLEEILDQFNDDDPTKE